MPRTQPGFTLTGTLVALGLLLLVLALAMRVAMLAIDELAAARAEALLQADGELALGKITQDIKQAEEVRCGRRELLLCLATGEHLRYVVDPREGALWRQMLNAGHRGRNRMTRRAIKVTDVAFEQRGSLVAIRLELETAHRRTGQPVTLRLTSAALPRN